MRSETIRSLLSVYECVQFRSRTEARWAVFFDSLGIEWEYEPEGYELVSGNYLPDFFLKNVNGGCFMEIKGQAGVANIALLEELSEMTNCPVYLAEGTPKVLPNSEIRLAEGNNLQLFCGEDSGDIHHWFCICEKCRKVGIEFNGRASRLCNCFPGSDKGYNFLDPRILNAITKACSYRFSNRFKSIPKRG